MDSRRHTRPAVCPLCEAACGIVVDVDGDRILAVRGDLDDPFSRGYLCPKATALPDLHHDPDRRRTPMVRTGTEWRETSWDDALDRAADGLARTRRQHGRDAVAIYYGNPVAHNLGLMTHALPFARALRTRNVYSASSADQLPQMVAAFRMFGHLALIPVPDLDRTDLLMILGANPVVSNGSLMTAPGMPRRLKALRQRGGRLVVIDPRRTETAAIADEHVSIRPGTDALLLAALLHVIIGERLVRLGRFEDRVNGLDAIDALVEPLTPERVEGRTGVPASTTRRLALDFARTARAACYGRVGMCTQPHGTVTSWLVQVLNLLTGHIDDVGGMMFTTPAIDAVGILRRLRLHGGFGRWRSRVRQLPEFGGDVPIATLADEIETGGRDQVRALVTIAGNPVLSAPNGSRLDRALATLDHMVAIDPYLNETTRHAHVLLPPAPPLARAHYPLAVYAFSVRNVARFADPVVAPAAGERHDWEIVTGLGARLFAPRPARHLVARAAGLLRPERLVEILLRVGPHRLRLADLRSAAHGMDLGPLEPGVLARRIATADGRVNAAPDDFVREAAERLPAEADAGGDDRLVLIGRRHLRTNNSWMHHVPRLANGGARCTLLIHPLDAASLGLDDGASARLESDAGCVVAPVEYSDTIRRGVVSLPHGWGHPSSGHRLRDAAGSPGVSLNAVTSEHRVDHVSGNAAFNGIPVRVMPASRSGIDDLAISDLGFVDD